MTTANGGKSVWMSLSGIDASAISADVLLIRISGITFLMDVEDAKRLGKELLAAVKLTDAGKDDQEVENNGRRL